MNASPRTDARAEPHRRSLRLVTLGLVLLVGAGCARNRAMSTRRRQPRGEPGNAEDKLLLDRAVQALGLILAVGLYCLSTGCGSGGRTTTAEVPVVWRGATIAGERPQSGAPQVEAAWERAVAEVGPGAAPDPTRSRVASGEDSTRER